MISESNHARCPLYRGIASLPPGFGPTVAAIGNFDGVHLGHREILSAVVRQAREQNAKAIAITFAPHPEEFLTPERAPKLITPGDARFELLAHTGIDGILLLDFNAELSALSARQFVQQFLVSGLHIIGLHEGANFRFGRRAEGGVSELAEFGKEFGFSLTIHDAVHVRSSEKNNRIGLEVSSSAIRAAVSSGQLNRARWMLGRPFGIRSHQVRDRGVGARLVVPTVNLAPYAGLVPAIGVYATRLTLAGRAFNAATNVGNRPTFAGAGFSIESYILNFEALEVGENPTVELEFLHRIRDEKTWPTPEALKAQIMRDVRIAQRYFARTTPL